MNKYSESRFGAALLAAAISVLINCLPARASAIDGLMSRAYQEMSSGHNEEAVRTMSVAVRTEPNNAMARRYLANALLRSGMAADALVQFRALIELKQATAKDKSAIGDANFYLSKYDDAIAWYQTALKEDPTLDSARVGLTHTYVAMKQHQKACQIIADAVRQPRTEESRREYYALFTNIKEQMQPTREHLDE